MQSLSSESLASAALQPLNSLPAVFSISCHDVLGWEVCAVALRVDAEVVAALWLLATECSLPLHQGRAPEKQHLNDSSKPYMSTTSCHLAL